jgi:hypothetical protein
MFRRVADPGRARTSRGPIQERAHPHRASSVRRHALAGQLLYRVLVLGKMRQPHAAQHFRRLGKLDVFVADDLYTVTPRVEEIKKRTGQWVHARLRQRLADGVLVIHDESKMTAVVSGLGATLLQREELIAQIDKGRGLAPTAKVEVEEATVERQRLIDITDLKSDMVETDSARFLFLGHSLTESESRG